MCECLQRPDGTWHVDDCCAWIMDAYHDGRVEVVYRVIKPIDPSKDPPPIVSITCPQCGTIYTDDFAHACKGPGAQPNG